jgi:hypothetical protein
MTLSIMPFSVMTLCIITLRKTTFNTIIKRNTLHNDIKCLFVVSYMLSVTIKPILLSVVIQIIDMLPGIMVRVVMLNVVAPGKVLKCLWSNH